MPSKLEIRQQFGQRNNFRGLLVCLQDICLLGLAFTIAAYWGHFWFVSLFIIWWVGCVQFAVGESLLHESSHGNLFKNPALNNAVGHFIAALIWTKLEDWREEHQVHHGYLLSPQDHLTKDYVDYQLHDGLHPFITWIFRPLIGIIGWEWIKSEWSGLFRNKQSLILYSLIVLFCWWTGNLLFFCCYWLLPLVWAYPAILYWSEITDHYLADTATRTNTSIFWNTLFHNGGYHWLHHEYPFIPWYLLPKAHRQLTPSNTTKVNGWWQMYQVMLHHYQQEVLPQKKG